MTQKTDLNRVVRVGDLLTLEEAAGELDVDPTTFLRWCLRDAGPKPAIDKGARSRLWVRADLIEWAKTNGKGRFKGGRNG